jgi:hypothetical protein
MKLLIIQFFQPLVTSSFPPESSTQTFPVAMHKGIRRIHAARNSSSVCNG